MVERQRGGRRSESVAGEVREVLEEEDEDQEGSELRKVSAVEKSDGGGGEQGQEVERKDAESAAGVEVSQAIVGVVGFPKAAGDKEAGEGEEEDDAGPAELGEVTGETLCGLGGLEASTVVEDEDEKDGEATEAVEGGVAAGFGGWGGNDRRRSWGRFEGRFSEGCVGSHLA